MLHSWVQFDQLEFITNPEQNGQLAASTFHALPLWVSGAVPSAVWVIRVTRLLAEYRKDGGGVEDMSGC